ncbi:MAG TPA: hypothetical protein VFE59_03665 [Trebonia sp.]|nr:hypothetical protein [Trebonia sp.]
MDMIADRVIAVRQGWVEEVDGRRTRDPGNPARRLADRAELTRTVDARGSRTRKADRHAVH